MSISEPAYAPYPLVTDAASLGFVETSLDGGTVVARHRPTRTSTRATLFLHGAAGSWSTWTPMLAAADEAGITIVNPVLFDLPGWGDATPPPGSPPLTLEIVCELARDLALELGYTEWDIVGHSLGGFIALHMASLWPQSVLSVSLVSGTTWSVIDAVAHPWHGMRVIPGFVLLRLVMKVLAPVEPVARALMRGLRAVGLLRLTAVPLLRHTARVDSSVIVALGMELRPRSFVTAGDVTVGYDADGRWALIECPVRATKGDRDVFVTDLDLARLERVLPGTVAVVVDDCGHFGNIERPHAVLAALGW